MSYFNICRDRHNKFIGFNVDGFTVKSWEQLQKLAEARIAKHDPSWDEIEINGEDLELEAAKLDLNHPFTDHTDMIRLDNAERQIDDLKAELESVKKKGRKRIISMKAEVRQEISSVKMILTAIKDGQSSHWQKKENIRLALEILATIPTFDRHDFFNYEDDF